MVETALDEEMTEHLGYDKHDRPAANRGTPERDRSKTVVTETAARWRSRSPGTGPARSNRRS